jgi:hypothetical protein
MPVIPALRNPRQENCEVQVSLDNLVRICVKKKKKKRKCRHQNMEMIFKAVGIDKNTPGRRKEGSGTSR